MAVVSFRLAANRFGRLCRRSGGGRAAAELFRTSAEGTASEPRIRICDRSCLFSESIGRGTVAPATGSSDYSSHHSLSDEGMPDNSGVFRVRRSASDVDFDSQCISVVRFTFERRAIAPVLSLQWHFCGLRDSKVSQFKSEERQFYWPHWPRALTLPTSLRPHPPQAGCRFNREFT